MLSSIWIGCAALRTAPGALSPNELVSNYKVNRFGIDFDTQKDLLNNLLGTLLSLLITTIFSRGRSLRE